MGQFDFTTGQTGVDIADHSARHEDTGADEISLTGLAGVPTVITNMVFYEDVVVSNDNEVVYNE